MKKSILCLILILCILMMAVALVACDDGEGGEVVDDGAKQGRVHSTTDSTADVDPNMPNEGSNPRY